MDKNTITGFILIALVLIVFSWWTRPSEEQMRQQQVQDSIAQVAKINAEKRQKAEAAKQMAAKQKAEEDSTALFHNALKGNDDLRVQRQFNISLQRYHNEIDELHKMLGINPPSPNEPVSHNPRNELQYITDRIPAYMVLRELKGEVREKAIKHLLTKYPIYKK